MIRIFFLLLSIACAAVVYLTSGYALDYAGSGIVGLVMLCGILIPFAMLVTGIFRKSKAHLSFGFLAAVVFGVSLAASNSLEDGHHENTRKTASDLIQSIERYQADKGGLPKTLADLVPDYIPDIPRPSFKLSMFHYRLDEKTQTFVISYNAPAWLLCQKSSAGEWHCDD